MALNAKNILFLAFLILLTTGCGHNYTQNQTILKAEKLLFTNPDSAYQLLISIKNPEKLSKADYAAWCLHYTHAQYKLYLNIKSDSLIKIAVNYYENSNLNQYSGTSYYLLACINEINSDTENAMYAYKKANDLLEKTNNNDVKGLVCYRIGNLYLIDEYFNESQLYFERALKNFEKSSNIKYLAYSNRALAELLFRQNLNVTDILEFTEKSIELSLKANDSSYYFDNLIFKANVLMDIDIKKSKSLLLNCFIKSSNKNNILGVSLAYIYSKLNIPDSAIYYSQYITINNDNKNIILLNNLTRAYVAYSEKDYFKSFHYIENAYQLQEAIYKQSMKEQLIRIDKQYDLSKKEAEKAKLEIQNQKNILLIAFLSIMVLGASVIILVIINVNKKRQAALVIEKQQLEFKVKTKQVENDKKLKILHSNLQNKIDNTLQFKKLQTNFSKAERKEEFIADITRQSVLTNVEWQFYIYEANELFEGKILNLREQYPQLTDADMNVIALICLGIDIGNSIILLDYSSFNTMYMRRMRIKNHLGLDKATDLERWLIEFVVEK